MSLPKCPQCSSEYTYEDGDNYVFPEYDAGSVIHAEPLWFYLDAMNIRVPPNRPGAAEVPLLEFSTATSGSSRSGAPAG